MTHSSARQSTSTGDARAAYERQKKQVAVLRRQWLSASEASMNALRSEREAWKVYNQAAEASTNATRAEMEAYKVYDRAASHASRLLEQIPPAG